MPQGTSFSGKRFGVFVIYGMFPKINKGVKMATENMQRDLFAFLPVVVRARLGKSEKILLFFYAWSYNWKKKKPSRYATASICAYLSMSKNTYFRARDRLEQLGWIVVTNKKQLTPCEVVVCMGVDDPNYEAQHWAKKYPKKTRLESARDHFAQAHPEMVWKPEEMLSLNSEVSYLIRSVSGLHNSVQGLNRPVSQSLREVFREETNNETNYEENDEW